MFINHNRPEPPVTIADLNERIEFPDRVYLNPEIKEMFHALGLIESYGSGIRRAKAAVEQNGSPAVVFGPANDTDALTSVTMGICQEFVETDRVVKGEVSKGAEHINDEINASGRENDEINDEISYGIVLTEDELLLVDALSKQPHGTYAQFAQELGWSEAKVYRLAKSLREKLVEVLERQQMQGGEDADGNRVTAIERRLAAIERR